MQSFKIVEDSAVSGTGEAPSGLKCLANFQRAFQEENCSLVLKSG